jgi:hypothetical protein
MRSYPPVAIVSHDRRAPEDALRKEESPLPEKTKKQRRTLGKMHAIFEVTCEAPMRTHGFINDSHSVTPAEVQTNGHVTWPALEAIVVSLGVCVQNRLRVDTSFGHPLKHRIGTKVREQWVINLQVSTAQVVKLFDFLLVRNCDVRKVLSW